MPEEKGTIIHAAGREISVSAAALKKLARVGVGDFAKSLFDLMDLVDSKEAYVSRPSGFLLVEILDPAGEKIVLEVPAA